MSNPYTAVESQGAGATPIMLGAWLMTFAAPLPADSQREGRVDEDAPVSDRGR